MPKQHFLVPFSDKQAAKDLGARWDPAARLWFAPTQAIADQLMLHWSPAADPARMDPLPGEDRTFVDLVPSSCWFTNVRSCIDPESWRQLSLVTRRRAGNRCEICGATPAAGEFLDAHERWHYDPARSIQALRRIIALCKPCHLVTHWGYARISRREALTLAHYKQVTGLDDREALRRVDQAFALWSRRSRQAWTLDLSIITDAGITLVRPASGP